MKSTRILTILIAAVMIFFFSLSKVQGFYVHTDRWLYGDLDQDSLKNSIDPNIASKACGPVAVTNSYNYLEELFPKTYGTALTKNKNLCATAVTLVTDYMHTTAANGTASDYFIWGKYRYIEDTVPNVTTYDAQCKLGWDVVDSSGSTVSKPYWVENCNPTWQWLHDELKAKKDVEILFSDFNDPDWGHYVTLWSFKWNDTNLDPNIINEEENAQIEFIDPTTGISRWVPIWSNTDEDKNCLMVNYCDTDCWVSMGVSEVPEPSTILLFFFGLVTMRKKYNE